MRTIPTIVNKNFQLLFNSKLSSLVLILGPLLLMIIVGGALKDTSIKNIEAGIYSEEGGEFLNNFTQNLESRGFITYKATSLEECKQEVISSTTQICIEIEKSAEIGGYESHNIILYVDFSKQRIVWRIIGNIQGLVEQESSKTRQIMLKDVRDKAGVIILQIESKETDLDSAINNVMRVEKEIQRTQSNEENSLNKINSTKNKLELLKRDLEAIEIGAKNLGDGGFISMVALRSLNNIKEIESELNDAETLIINTGLSATEEKIFSIKSQLIRTQDILKKIKADLKNIEEINEGKITDPVVLTYKSVSSDQEGKIEKKLEFLDYLFPSFLIFFILFTSVIISGIFTIREKSSNAYIRNIASKRNGANFVVSTFITSFILVSIQTVIILILAKYFLNINPLSNLSSLLPILAISISIFTLIGIVIGHIFNSYESTITASIVLILIFFIFSSIITPIETLAKTLSNIASLFPLTLLETKLRIVMIFDAPLKLFLNEILTLIGMFLFTTILIILFYRKNKEKEI